MNNLSFFSKRRINSSVRYKEWFACAVSKTTSWLVETVMPNKLWISWSKWVNFYEKGKIRTSRRSICLTSWVNPSRAGGIHLVLTVCSNLKRNELKSTIESLLKTLRFSFSTEEKRTIYQKLGFIRNIVKTT